MKDSRRNRNNYLHGSVTSRKKITIFCIILVILCLAIVVFVKINGHNAYKIKLNNNIDRVNTLLREAGVNGISKKNGCENDPNIKFGGPLLCGISLDYSAKSDDGEKLLSNYNKIFDLIRQQNVITVPDLEKNQKVDGADISTYSQAQDNETRRKCNVSLSYQDMVVGSEDMLSFNLWCSTL
ncbi:hypothetical protein H0X10_04495 [Candidatus Saccharibacteria bacterium]|nr:hypothetical protein [Candidatus Saccharibacteria bacterium]